uniref:BPTI/Kunitz inhibitor domain-containing protein n=1 Tax=Acrobeloides nanus TaxID=290746 RepID=A0A914C9N7_9BILA
MRLRFKYGGAHWTRLKFLPLVLCFLTVCRRVGSECVEGNFCRECNLLQSGEPCFAEGKRESHFFCDTITNRIRLDPTSYFECIDGITRVIRCAENREFYIESQQCEEISVRQKTRKRSTNSTSSTGGSRTGDICNFNTDCQSGMFCGSGVCSCLSDFVAISGYCWPKVNPGESGCIEDLQCEAVWPAARCSLAGMCECPPKTVPSRTRDGTQCVTSAVPPACPLPESNNPDVPSPATILANPKSHPLAQNTYMPVLCTSMSNEVRNSHGGDGSTWCVYPDGESDIYIADIYNCVPHPQVNPQFFPEYSKSVDGICCHTRAFVCIQPLEPGDEPSLPRWWFNSITGTCSQFLWDPNQSENVSPNNFRTIEHCESYCRDTCKRGPIQFSESKWSLMDDSPVVNCVHSTGSCAPEYQCTLIGSQQTCCPTVAHICSPYGGRNLAYTPVENYDRGAFIAGGRTVTRYYYDADQARCMNFLYDGLGNYNNFLTKQDCENFCAKYVPSPATILANPKSHPLAQNTYMPVLCTSMSNEVRNSHGGDGSTWCVYPDGESDIYIADIYNCVPHPQVNPQFFPEYSKSVDGICCHTRAFVCIQPLEPGDEPSLPRWWFNSITGTCSQFLWDPNQSENVSPNNFRTIEHCESYCRDTCKRGPIQFSESKWSLMDDAPVVNCVHSTGSCAPEYQCTLIGSQQTCCPTVAHICSPYGGRNLAYTPVENYDRGAFIAGGRTVTRYYYDADQARCMNFLYDGLGNYNNFLTKQDCENFCAKLVCEYGNPLRIGEDWQRCETNMDCPSSHQCEPLHKVCCPTAQSICTQPKRLGDCTSSVRRYWYNSATRQCELFQYTGCQGNDNNFDSLLTCQQKCRGVALEPKCTQGKAHKDANGNFYACSTKGDGKSCPPNYQCFFDGASNGCCPTKSYTCSLSPDKGVQCGAGRSFRYYFNSNKQTCESFQYEGCDGNSNNFQSLEDCQDYCGVGGCPFGGQPLRDVASNQLVMCSEASKCPPTHDCVTININGNVVYRCCPTKAHICSLPPQQGNQCSKMSITRYYFNIVIKECAQFSFNGCNGNLNNFNTLEQCSNFCSSAACNPGEVTYKDINTKKVIECSPAMVNSCPTDYVCKYDPLSTKHACCGTPPTDVCPEGERAFINAIDESVKECAINLAGACPTGFLCRFSPNHNRYYCCASKSGNVCPDGKALYRVSKTLEPNRCTLNSASNTCPDGYSCQSRAHNVLQGYCCTAQNVCKGGGEFYIDDRSKMPKICTPGAFITCPVGYRCQKAINSVNGYCCKGEITAVTEGCPPGEYAYTQQKVVVRCDPFNPENLGCPEQYSCQYAISHQRYQCCGKEPYEEEEVVALEHGCPAGQVAFLAKMNGSPQACTSSSSNSCPFGYFCQFSDKNKQFQCCAHKSGCPGNSVSFVDITGNPKECKAGIHGQCAVGYSCQRTREGRYHCCSIDRDQLNLMPNLPMTKTTHLPALLITPALVKSANSSISIERKPIKCHLPNEIYINGICRPRKLGDACMLTEQCPATSVCLSLICACPRGAREVNGECVPIGTTQVKNASGAQTEPISNSKSGNCKPAEVEYNGQCLKLSHIGGNCEISKQCINSGECVRKKCRCPAHTAGYKGKCVANICGINKSSEPQLMFDSMAVRCVNSPCKSPYKCMYSSTISDYVCSMPRWITAVDVSRDKTTLYLLESKGMSQAIQMHQRDVLSAKQLSKRFCVEMCRWV